jgi:hypothetical protein
MKLVQQYNLSILVNSPSATEMMMSLSFFIPALRVVQETSFSPTIQLQDRINEQYIGHNARIHLLQVVSRRHTNLKQNRTGMQSFEEMKSVSGG